MKKVLVTLVALMVTSIASIGWAGEKMSCKELKSYAEANTVYINVLQVTDCFKNSCSISVAPYEEYKKMGEKVYLVEIGMSIYKNGPIIAKGTFGAIGKGDIVKRDLEERFGPPLVDRKVYITGPKINREYMPWFWFNCRN